MTAIEIEELCESGEDGGDLMGYYARGHHDHQAFALACNAYSGAHTFDDRRHVTAQRVRHVWYRTVQMSNEPKGTMEFRSSTPGPGAWAATVSTPITDHSDKIYRRCQHAEDRGYSRGFTDALSWVLQQLEWGLGPRDETRHRMLQGVSDDLREAYRNGDAARQGASHD